MTAEVRSRGPRPAVVLLACLLGLAGSLVGGAAASTARGVGTSRTLPNHVTVIDTGRVSFSAFVHPRGRATTVYFQYGLAARYREPRPPAVVYDESTPRAHLHGDLSSQQVFGKAARLVANAVYHVRLVASSRAGAVYSPDATFTTAKDPAPPPPRIGVTVNVKPLSGLVLVEPPANPPAQPAQIASLLQGKGFLPLTELRRLATDWRIDARAGALTMVVASPRRGHMQRIELAGGLLSVSQPRMGIDRGVTTVALHTDEFPGAPTYSGCVQTPPGASGNPGPTPQASSQVVQTLHARDQAGRFRTQDRYSAATAAGAGTVWDTVERCDGTLTIVHHGTVVILDHTHGTTTTVQSGQSYLALAP